ncbi:MAG: TonB-dependent receptor [Bacteroidota bacterium]
MKLITSVLMLVVLHPFALRSQEVIISADTTKVPEMDIGEISVRASKVNTKLKELPASVSMITLNTIEDNNIRSLTDVSSIAANFFMPDYGSKLTSPVYIRGIGSRINSPSVGLYVDNVPFFEKASFNFDFFDIQRIEVLRGPQGTLYGRNTMGGIINIITPSPLQTKGGRLSFSTGNFGYYNTTGSYYGNISGNFAYSLSFNYLHKNGYFSNAFTDDAVDRSNSYGLRNRLVWTVNDNMSIENIISAEHSKEGGYPYAVINEQTGEANEINYNQYSYYNRKILSDAFIVKYTGDNFELVSTSSYQYMDDLQGIDQDFTPDSLYYVIQDQTHHMLSQELVIKTRGEKRYSWLIGAYAFGQFFDKAVDVDVYGSSIKLIKGYDHIIRGYALFHQSTLKDLLVKNLSLTAGVRIDHERDILDYLYNMQREETFTNMADTVYPALEYFELLPKIALNYEFNNNNLYLTVARGYKTGGFNSTIERPEDLTYNPEYSWNYELGAKTSLLNKQLYADFALFYIDWKNQQIYQTVPSGRGSMLKNAGISSSKGMELSLRAIPLCGYETSMTYGYTHAKFISHIVNDSVDHDGNFIPYVPTNTLTVKLNKTYYIESIKFIDRLRFNILYRGIGPIRWNEENSHTQGFYSLFDFQIAAMRKKLGFELWFKNLLNTDYEAFYFQALGREYVQHGKPLRFGIRLSAEF